MNEFLQDDAWHVLDQYRNGVVTDPYTALDIHRLFAHELMLNGLATLEECRETERALVVALNLVTNGRAAQPVNTTLSKEV
ncbi:hypothetical protein [Streptomyces sp. NPDC051310]|uniref:hypothetical protein n=1 Tax=Streptomyces sp. NPDC051310 TaxID=3365649 RepID=UPI0037B82EA4